MRAYGVISDTHHHNWSQFATTLPNGVNSRLQVILDETWRAAEWVKSKGGTHLFHTGDLMHVRGVVAPSVLNPTLDVYARIVRDLGLSVHILSGNHDLEGNESSALGSSVTALRGVGVTVVNEPCHIASLNVLMIPWQPSVDALRAKVAEFYPISRNTDLFIHAPMNGVISGIPESGLGPEEVAAWGFRRTFVGHYHNHRAFNGDVYSVGALTHQTFGDIGAMAGFLMVDDFCVQHCPSMAPKFMDVYLSDDPDEGREAMQGNYIRCKPQDFNEEQLRALREELLLEGAAGVVMHPVKSSSVVMRSGMTSSGSITLIEQVNKFCKESPGMLDPEKLAVECQSVLAEVGAPL